MLTKESSLYIAKMFKEAYDLLKKAEAPVVNQKASDIVDRVTKAWGEKVPSTIPQTAEGDALYDSIKGGVTKIIILKGLRVRFDGPNPAFVNHLNKFVLAPYTRDLQAAFAAEKVNTNDYENTSSLAWEWPR